ncbi:protein kinase domain protein [Penicillium brevicompactum]|uniref:protein kinase domain protein n=1 Tax=Penicillium brevicompactum TaxID=5074 RepID=UPI0025408823|nr:protein kinase domain protein [Penicillium brevicompactum]KAJ5333044.1 protein kinase domain protein [Penicillium brevicompactum]
MVIGDVLNSRYQVVGKLGFGVSSTVWLARDMRDRRYVALKVYTGDEDNKNEFEIYKQLSKNSQHPGREHVREALDSFTLSRPGGDHHCLVQKPLWESLHDLHYVMPHARLEVDILKSAIKQMLLALDYIHTECKLVHTDIKPDNIMQELNDTSVLEKFVQDEVKKPSPRKITGDRIIYLSRLLDPPKQFGRALLCDFGSAVQGEEERNHNAQPEIYRSPEVMLMANWSYPADIWNLGVMIWFLLQGQLLFTGLHPTLDKYITRAHLAEIVGLLGPPPHDLIQKGVRGSEFFDEDEDRKTAAALLQDPWLNS